MIDIVYNLTNKLLSEGIDEYKKRKEFVNYRICIAEKVGRELRVNREIVTELQKKKDVDGFVWKGKPRCELYRALRTNSYESVYEGLIPIGIIFEGSFEISDDLLLQVNVSNVNQLKNRLKECDSVAELLMRTFHRLEMSKLYSEHSVRDPDLSYLGDLINLSIHVLTKTNDD